MKIRKSTSVLFSFIILSVFFGNTRNLSAQTKEKEESAIPEYRNYIGTSVLALLSLIPGDETFFLQLDYGRRLSTKNDIVLGANIYKYRLPMSAPWTETETYPGSVISSGIVVAWQHYLWKGFFIDQIMNPLIPTYKNPDGSNAGTGFMLLFATRSGYHFDFNMLGNSFFLELAAEMSYWPVNTGIPSGFSEIDRKYSRHVPSAAVQFGINF